MASRRVIGQIARSMCWVGVGGFCLAAQAPVHAQSVVPSQVIPRSFAPQPERAQSKVEDQVEIAPDADPAGGDLVLQVGSVALDGAFAEMAPANQSFVREISNKAVTVKSLFEAVRKLERTYADAGYVLARINVPRQRFTAGGAVKVVVTDGYLEQVVVDGLPARLRDRVRRQVSGLVRVKHLTLRKIERDLLLVADNPGLELRSALAKGSESGAGRLILSGVQDRFDFTTGVGNKLPASLGRWQVSGTAALNDKFGAGEQVYFVAASGTDLDQIGADSFMLGVIGGGVTVPVGRGGLKVGAEYIVSRSVPKVAEGGLLAVGRYSRGQVKARMPLYLTRNSALFATASVDIVRQSLALPDFGTELSEDRYVAARLNVAWAGVMGPVSMEIDTTYSRGVGGRNPTEELPASRQGSSPRFTRTELQGNVNVGLSQGMALNFTIRAQRSFGESQMTSEQFALDAEDAVSSFSAGSYNVDSGATLRTELRWPSFKASRHWLAAPYIFAAAGTGHVYNSTAAEAADVRIGALGLGARVSVNRLPLLGSVKATLGFEYGRQFVRLANQAEGDRLNLQMAIRF